MVEVRDQFNEFHFISVSAKGEECGLCQSPAAHKIGEEIPYDTPLWKKNRHNFTTYVCCDCFRKIMGEMVFCRK